MCQFDAITIHEIAEIDRNVCTGCGVCTRVCPEGSITLLYRPFEETKPIPENEDAWLKQRREARGMKV